MVAVSVTVKFISDLFSHQLKNIRITVKTCKTKVSCMQFYVDFTLNTFQLFHWLKVLLRTPGRNERILKN